MRTALHRSLLTATITLGELAAMLLCSAIVVATCYGIGLAIEAVIEIAAEGVAAALIETK